MDLEKQQNTKQILKEYLISFFATNLESITFKRDRIEYIGAAMHSVIWVFKLFDEQQIKYHVETEPPHYNLITFFPNHSHENIRCVLEKGFVVDIIFDIVFSADQIEQINNLIAGD